MLLVDFVTELAAAAAFWLAAEAVLRAVDKDVNLALRLPTLLLADFAAESSFLISEVTFLTLLAADLSNLNFNSGFIAFISFLIFDTIGRKLYGPFRLILAVKLNC